MTAVDGPDNGQDEGPWRVGSHYGIHVYEGTRPLGTFLRPEDAARAVAAVNSARAGAGEQQRARVEALIRRYNTGKPSWSVAEFADELLALLGGPQPDGEAEPCPVYSHDTDGWHCAVEGPHDEHRNAAGDTTWT